MPEKKDLTQTPAASFDMDFSKHDQFGNFLTHFDEGIPSGIIDADDRVTPLEDSSDLTGIFMLSDTLLLGYDVIWKSYHPDFVAAGYQQSDSFPMALWDAKTGKKRITLQGLHTGSPRGAKLLDETRLITWARDFRVFVWDLQTGERIDTLTSPILTDEDGYAVVSSRNGERYSAKDWQDYLEGRGAPGFNVTIYLKPNPDGQHEQCGPFKGPEGQNTTIRRYTSAPAQQIDHRDLMRRIQDLEGVEAGYSTPFRLKDGRMGVGGTTHGAWEQIFIWDGLKDLNILIPKSLGTNCEINGEIAPNTIRIDNYSETYIFEDI